MEPLTLELLVIVRVDKQFSIVRWIDVSPDSKPAASCIENPRLHLSWFKFNGSKQDRLIVAVGRGKSESNCERVERCIPRVTQRQVSIATLSACQQAVPDMPCPSVVTVQ